MLHTYCKLYKDKWDCKCLLYDFFLDILLNIQSLEGDIYVINVWELSFPCLWKLLLEKGCFGKERSCQVFTEHWNDVAILWRRHFRCKLDFFIIWKALVMTETISSGLRQSLLVSGHTDGMEILSHEKNPSLPALQSLWYTFIFLSSFWNSHELRNIN